VANRGVPVVLVHLQLRSVASEAVIVPQSISAASLSMNVDQLACITLFTDLSLLYLFK